MYLRFYFRGTGRNKLTVETFARIFYRNKPFASGKSLRGDTKHRKRFDPRPTLSVNVKWRSHTLDNLLPSPSLTPTAVSSPPPSYVSLSSLSPLPTPLAHSTPSPLSPPVTGLYINSSQELTPLTCHVEQLGVGPRLALSSWILNAIY